MGELTAGLPRIPSSILAARLKELQAAGVLRRLPHSRVIVYELTTYGCELEPVVEQATCHLLPATCGRKAVRRSVTIE